MKYLIVGKYKDPVDKNVEKRNKIAAERGTAWGEGDVVTRYVNVSDGKFYYIVDTDDPACLARYLDRWGVVFNITISVLMTPSEYSDAVPDSVLLYRPE